MVKRDCNQITYIDDDFLPYFDPPLNDKELRVALGIYYQSAEAATGGASEAATERVSALLWAEMSAPDLARASAQG